MAISLTQLGGYRGSYAGDCALISTDDWQCLVDLGRGLGCEQTDAALRLWKERGGGSLNIATDVVITHFHADHMGNLQTWRKLAEQRLFHHDVYRNQDQQESVLRTFDVKKHLTDSGPIVEGASGKLRYVLSAIVPSGDDVSDENDYSMGVLFEVWHKDKKNPVLSFLGLGDMTPNAANAAVERTLRERGYLDRNSPPIHAVKLAHHGSENNLLPVLDSVVREDETRVLISGYTMTDTRKLREKLALWKPKICAVLFDQRSTAREFHETAATKRVLDEHRSVMAFQFRANCTAEGVTTFTADELYTF